MFNQQPLSRESGLDHTISLIREGYMFIPNRKKSFNSDVFETHLLGKKAICLTGQEAAELFYDEDKFKRNGAVPKRALKTLFGETGVQTLDGAQHHHRKEMFMSLMTMEQLDRLSAIAREQCDIAAAEWEQKGEIQLYHESQKLLLRIACQWAGVPLWANELERFAHSLAQLFESPAKGVLKNKAGRAARKGMEKWAEQYIDDVRSGKLKSEEGTALHTIAMHRDLNGDLLDLKTAAVELLNIIRPITAVSIFVNFTAIALIQHPEERRKLAGAEPEAYRCFVQEVRRFYPFFPFAGAMVKKDFTWKGHQFKKGNLALLDLYGTNHDPAIWDQPDVFNPDRFKNWQGTPFNFIPQGGGDYTLGHRCPGEWATIRIMESVLDLLANGLEYELPQQDLSYSMVEMPSLPKSRIILNQIRRKAK